MTSRRRTRIRTGGLPGRLLLCAGLCWLVFAAAPVGAQPSDYAYTINNGFVTITAYNGAGGAVVIPSTLNGWPVTTLGDHAFASCATLTSVVIPNGVTGVGTATFSSCTGLTNITLGARVARVGSFAFSGCTSLTQVFLPNTVTNIGSGPFYQCRNLTGIEVDGSNPAYSAIDGVLFNRDQTLLVQCPGTKAGAYAIPGSVMHIGPTAFARTALSQVTIPGRVNSLAGAAFSGCAQLVAITVEATNPAYRSVDGVVFSKDLLTLVAWPAGKARTCLIPAGVTSIGEAAFLGCTVLTNVTIPASVTRIGVRAFESCTGLTSVALPASVAEIGEYAFTDCGSLTAVYCLGQAPRVGSFPFSRATIYHLPGTGFWGTYLSGSPTALWDPELRARPVVPGVGSSVFGLEITGYGPLPFVVEACADLARANWVGVGTNTLVGGLSYFSDPGWTNAPFRFYRLRAP